MYLCFNLVTKEILKMGWKTSIKTISQKKTESLKKSKKVPIKLEGKSKIPDIWNLRYQKIRTKLRNTMNSWRNCKSESHKARKYSKRLERIWKRSQKKKLRLLVTYKWQSTISRFSKKSWNSWKKGTKEWKKETKLN